MPRRKEVPATYEEFDRGLAGYRDQDIFDASGLVDGRQLNLKQIQKIANHVGATVVDQSIVMRPATYGERNQNRRAQLAMIAQRITD